MSCWGELRRCRNADTDGLAHSLTAEFHRRTDDGRERELRATGAVVCWWEDRAVSAVTSASVSAAADDDDADDDAGRDQAQSVVEWMSRCNAERCSTKSATSAREQTRHWSFFPFESDEKAAAAAAAVERSRLVERTPSTGARKEDSDTIPQCKFNFQFLCSWVLMVISAAVHAAVDTQLNAWKCWCDK